MRNSLNRKVVVALLGPTAIGKTDLALQLARLLPVEIISVDSAMIYKGLNIGSAKPDGQQLQQTPHHLIDILDPDQPYSVGAFCRDVQALVEQIHARQKTPLLVGGTMLYFKALQQGLADMPPVPVGLRQALQQEAVERGLAALYQELVNVDPVLAARLHVNDQLRILRGLEIYRTTGQQLSLLQKASKKQVIIDSHWIIWPHDRSKLQQRIDRRFDDMLAKGLIEEVQSLRQHYLLDSQSNSMRAIGYRQVWQYLTGQIDEPTMRQQGQAATRQLAKRQLTWLRSWPDGQYFRDDDPHLLSKLTHSLQDHLGNNDE